MEVQLVKFQDVRLDWSDWHDWSALEVSGIVVPEASGVYEVRLKGSEERLTIGKASNLRRRVWRSLILGKLPHSSGKRIRANEDTSTIEVRWAETDRPAAVEEELHRLHRAAHGHLPTYTLR